MKKAQSRMKNILILVLVLSISFGAVILLQELCSTQVLAPMIYVLAVFLVSLTTRGYVWGIVASLLSVLAVNFAFTFPFFEFNFSIPENLVSALAMLFVAVTTSTLTTRIKNQERMRAESEKEKVRANLLRAVSHDLRTPLTSIYGACSTILENYDLLTREQKLKLLRETREDSEWLIRMVENLLSVTRIDGAKVSIIKTPTVLEELIDAVLLKFKKRYPQQTVEVEIPDRFISIPMDAMLIEQVLTNLLENAVFHAKGMTRLSLRVFTAGSRAVFEIADNGCGIPHERLEALRKGYGENGCLPTDSSKHNMGIGLSVCAAIIKAHDGELQVESSVNQGTTIRFSLETEDTENEQ